MKTVFDVEKAVELEGHAPLWYWAKGHVPKDRFRDRVLLEYGEEFLLSDVEHVYIRKVPGGFGDGTMILYYATAGCRGAFPATLIDIEAVK